MTTTYLVYKDFGKEGEDMEYAVAALVAVVALAIVFLCIIIHGQGSVIRELTNKLMARNYTDYVTGSQPREAMPDNIHVRKPMSWFDDGTVPDVDGDKT